MGMYQGGKEHGPGKKRQELVWLECRTWWVRDRKEKRMEANRSSGARQMPWGVLIDSAEDSVLSRVTGCVTLGKPLSVLRV